MENIFLILRLLSFLSIIYISFLIIKILLFGFKKTHLNIKFIAFASGILLLFFFTQSDETIINKNNIFPDSLIVKDSLASINPNYLFAKELITENKLDIKNLDLTQVTEEQIKKNDNITKILQPFNVSNKMIFELDNYLKKNRIFNFNKIKQNDTYALLFSKDSISQLLYFGYELNQETYLFVNLNNTLEAEIKKRPFQIKRHELAGIIESSLWNALDSFVDTNLEKDAIVSVISEKIYPWTINFFALFPEDRFKIIYDAKYINNEFVEIDHIFASVFMHNGKNYYAFPFEEKGQIEFYDNNGNNLRNFFLQAPVSYKRISSRYSKARRHPVTGRVKAHKGTDFAAQKGSKIYSTADGVVIAATYKKYNGYYVKIKHNNTYETQYLHMQKKSRNFWNKNGIKPGKKIKQGEIIGFVGQTGLATGPHVCYRFWKNGKQVDPFRENLPPSEPIKSRHRASFNLKKDKLISELNSIPYPDQIILNLNPEASSLHAP